MNRRVANQDLGGGKQRVRVQITTERCDEKGSHSMKVRGLLLTTIAEVPDFTKCGYETFQKLRIFHDGDQWIAELEATMDIPEGALVGKTSFGSGATGQQEGTGT